MLLVFRNIPTWGKNQQMVLGPFQKEPLLGSKAFEICLLSFKALVLQTAQSRSYLHTLRPKVGVIYILGAAGNKCLGLHRHSTLAC